MGPGLKFGAALLLALATEAAAQAPYSAREEATLRLLAPATIVNPTDLPLDAARARARARPRDADAWHQLGESLDAAGDPGGAARAYEQATRLPPRVIGRAFLYRDLARAREQVGDVRGALAAARVSVRSWPLSRTRLFCLGSEAILLTRLLVKTHDLAGAVSFYRPLHDADRGRAACREIYEALAGNG